MTAITTISFLLLRLIISLHKIPGNNIHHVINSGCKKPNLKFPDLATKKETTYKVIDLITIRLYWGETFQLEYKDCIEYK